MVKCQRLSRVRSEWRAQKYMAKAFPLYKKWGVEGVMLDFMDRDDQEMNRFVRRAVKLAAANRLTVTLHGCPKPRSASTSTQRFGRPRDQPPCLRSRL